MDDPSFYGFPTYAEGGNGALVKAAQDCGGAVDDGGRAGPSTPTRDALDLLSRFVERLLPGVGAPARTVTCLYTLTPDRDFVVGPLPGAPVGAASGSAPRTGSSSRRRSAGCSPTLPLDGATTSDIAAFAVDRPALAEAGHPVSWLV